ncbi:SDR family NAD(P)-dependent oxidoreductase [Mycolicibacterium moriokaense]|nr:SDR family NAD(P)-dependent oxidoreductase [Mycolicibacterium moriokaense]
METFEGRGAVITGGASGIGFASAQEFTRRGARVVLADINQSTLDEAVGRLRADGAEAHGVLCDVTKLEAVEHLADESFRLLGEVNLVFNNAGIAYAGPVADVTHGDWRWVIDVDLWGPIHGVEAFLPRLVEQGGDRHIVFTASFAGMVGNAFLGPYSVAKFGVVALAEGLARELKSEGIGVSVLCPMIVDTPLMANSEFTRSADYGARSEQAEAIAQGLVAPTDEDVRPDDVARLTADSVLANRLYILPHRASRESIRRRFERIDRTYEQQAAEGWTH